MKKSDLYRRNAEKCVQMAEAAKGEPAYNRFKRMEAAWLALAEEQDWLDGERSGRKGTWSDDEERKLMEMRAAGKSFPLIARALGRSQASCASRWYLKIREDSRDSSGTPPEATP